MKGTTFCSFVMILQSACWVCVTGSRTLAASHDGQTVLHGTYQNLHTLQVPPSANEVNQSGGLPTKEVEAVERKMGSSPPSCEHKCLGCMPCQAIQVPTTSSSRVRLGLHYANYEPEGWKCKCGSIFYTP